MDKCIASVTRYARQEYFIPSGTFFPLAPLIYEPAWTHTVVVYENDVGFWKNCLGSSDSLVAVSMEQNSRSKLLLSAQSGFRYRGYGGKN